MNNKGRELGKFIKIFGSIGLGLFFIIGLFNASTIPAFIECLITGGVNGCCLGLNVWIISRIIRHFTNKSDRVDDIKLERISKINNEENKSNTKNLKITKNITKLVNNDIEEKKYNVLENKETSKVYTKRR